MPPSDDRFARQNRCGPPPGFPLASPCAGIDHHLSGPNAAAPTRILPPRLLDRSTVRPRGGSRLRSPSLRARVSCRPSTRADVRLLGPCFKTGRRRPLRQRPRPKGALLGPSGGIEPGPITPPAGGHVPPAILPPREPTLARAAAECTGAWRAADPPGPRLVAGASPSAISRTV